ncbi:MAG: hypothetical protein U5O15_06085 [Candidatus Krumholzibacteriota bacterium]|nr:hypothetical protein [Candidatus Krumholzibacteriota bacterium]
MLIFRSAIFPLIILLAASVFIGCSEDLFTGEMAENKPPVVRLTRVPIERSTTSYKIHFYWDSFDPDGEVEYCEYIIVSGDPYGFSPADTMVEWEKAFTYTDKDSTEIKVYNDKIFAFQCDSVSSRWEEDSEYTKFEKTNTFFIRAIDKEGAISKVEHVSFTSWTLSPTCTIEKPKGTARNYSVVITFGWKATDFIDSPDNKQFPESIRYLCSSLKDIGNLYPEGQDKPNEYNIADSMNSSPKKFYSLWGDWKEYSSTGEGSGVVYGDDIGEELIPSAGKYIFAIQAKDEAGAVTSIMKRDADQKGNLRDFVVSPNKTPNLTIREATIGSSTFTGTSSQPKEVFLPPGVELNFSWSANAIEYGGMIVGYRYGWDIINTQDAEEWDVSTFGLDYKQCTKEWTTGSHTLYVEAKDDAGHVSRGLIRIQIVQFEMERDLLLVDDWISYMGTQTNWNGQLPIEDDHDNFLAGIINDNLGSNFNDAQFPAGDVYPTTLGALEISDIADYKNIIWIYSSSTESEWKKNLEFVGESESAESSSGSEISLNLIKLFLHTGGHVLTYGYSARSGGGLTDCFDGDDFNRKERNDQRFPISIENDLIGNENDESYEDCMVYADYGVRVMNKIAYADYEDFADNSMTMAILDRNDPVTSMYPGLPDTLKLNENITGPGWFWDWHYESSDPSRCGLWYVETFDGPDDMENEGISGHLDWFHPMYRMKACSEFSEFNNSPVGLILTKNAYRVPLRGTSVPANSFHFGFPLWYLEHESVEKIFETVFTEWQIKK